MASGRIDFNSDKAQNLSNGLNQQAMQMTSAGQIDMQHDDSLNGVAITRGINERLTKDLQYLSHNLAAYKQWVAQYSERFQAAARDESAFENALATKITSDSHNIPIYADSASHASGSSAASSSTAADGAERNTHSLTD